MDSLPSRSPGRSSESPTVSSRKLLLNYNSSSSLSSKSFTDASSQSFFSILNNPNPTSSAVVWWPSTSLPAPEFAPLPSAPKPGSELTRSDLLHYLSSISELHSRFVDILRQNDRDKQGHVDVLTVAGGAVGEALVACLREVPALYFKEDFELEDGATFKAACPFRTISENVALQERLSQYLDVVELHLVKEISLRSNSFFEAQGQLEDLNGKIVEGCVRVRELKEMISLLDTNLVGSARIVQELSQKRGDLITLHNKLMLVLSVNQALSTLSLLVASADCVGALDITDDLQHLLDGDEVIGLHCFRHLRDHVAASIESINSILSAEFIRASLHGVGDMDVSIATTAFSSNGRNNEFRLEEDRTSNFQDQLLPLVVGLLRTGKLPSVLRIYRDTLASDIKTSVKTVVLNMPLESDSISGEGMVDADGGGSSLGSKLRSLSADSFLKLLEEIFQIVQTRLWRAYEVKRAIEWIMGNLDGHYAAASVAAAIAHGAAAPDTTHGTDSHISPFLPQFSQTITRAPSIQGRGYDSSTSNISRNFRADILRENAEALFSACDTAHGRWAKIVAIRSQIHTRMRLQDFLSVYNVTQEFISSTERIGGRLGYSLRGTLQSQAKSFIDFQHESRMAKMRALLDQENWVEIDVPEEFQIIVTSLSSLDSISTGESDGTPDNIASISGEVVSSNSDSFVADAEPSNSQLIKQPDSNGTSMDHMPTTDSSRLSEATEKSDVSTSTQGASASMNRGKSSLRVLCYKGVGYHMVNCGLYLVKMLSEYVEMSNFLHALSPQVVNHVAEILKLFNSRTAHLVLGANALQVSGLRSITSRHLAMASQVISFTYAILPEIRRILLLKVPETYKGLLQSEINRVANDYKNHRDEIHSKLVQIMRERLLVHLRSLAQIIEGWNRSEDTDLQPSQFARSLTKEVGFLLRTLSKLLLEEDVQAIFGQVVIILHSQISEALSQFEISTPQAKSRLQCDIQHILGCIRSLPSDNSSKSSPPNWGQLDELLAKSIGSESGETG